MANGQPSTEHLKGGLGEKLGARVIFLFSKSGSKDQLYRVVILCEVILHRNCMAGLQLLFLFKIRLERPRCLASVCEVSAMFIEEFLFYHAYDLNSRGNHSVFE